jgi:hypothetical protein
VQRDRLPNPVDVGSWDVVSPQHLGSQVGALDLEASLAPGMLAEPQVVHDGSGEEQLFVVSRIVQGALKFGKQAREDEASDAVVSDRRTLRRADEREARLSERPRREHENVVHRAALCCRCLVEERVHVGRELAVVLKEEAVCGVRVDREPGSAIS